MTRFIIYSLIISSLICWVIGLALLLRDNCFPYQLLTYCFHLGFALFPKQSGTSVVWGTDFPYLTKHLASHCCHNPEWRMKTVCLHRHCWVGVLILVQPSSVIVYHKEPISNCEISHVSQLTVSNVTQIGRGQVLSPPNYKTLHIIYSC